MIVCFYDKDFNALPDCASLDAGTWAITKKAVDFDSASFTSEAFKGDMNPCIVVFKNDIGRYVYAGFAGVPALNSKGQATCEISDLRTYLNNEILYKWNGEFTTQTTIKSVFESIMQAFKEQVAAGEFDVECDYEGIEYVKTYNETSGMYDCRPLTIDEIYAKQTGMTEETSDDCGGLILGSEEKVYNAWDLLKNYCKFYDIVIRGSVDLSRKKIIYKFLTTLNEDKIRDCKLWELDKAEYGKYIAKLNEAAVKILLKTDSGSTIIDGPVYWLSPKIKQTGAILSEAIVRTDKNPGKYEKTTSPNKRKVFLYTITNSTETDPEDETQTATLDSIDIEAMLEAGQGSINYPAEVSTDYLKAWYDGIYNAIIDTKASAIAELASARYNEGLEFSTASSQTFDGVDFEFTFKIYAKRGDAAFKKLAVGEIYEDSNGKKTLKLGYKNDDILAYI